MLGTNAIFGKSSESTLIQRNNNTTTSRLNRDLSFLKGRTIENHEGSEITFLGGDHCDVFVKKMHLKRNVKVLVAPSFPVGKKPNRYNVIYINNKNVVVISEYGLKGGVDLNFIFLTFIISIATGIFIKYLSIQFGDKKNTITRPIELQKPKPKPKTIELEKPIEVKKKTSLFTTAKILHFVVSLRQKVMKKKQDIVFVGGGPVGLWTATLVKILKPETNICILEKYIKYQRDQTLDVELESFESSADLQKKDKDLNDFVQKLKDIRKTVNPNQQAISIPIQELETMLLELAKAKGISVLYREVLKPDQLPSEFPNAHTFVGSDGSRSVVRSNIFTKARLEETYDYNAVVSYSVAPPAKVVGGSKGLWTILKTPGVAAARLSMNNALWQEQVSKDNRINLIFGISQELYNSMAQANAKNPWVMKKVDLTLQEDIFLWIGMKRKLHNEKVTKESVNVSVRKLAFTTSNVFVKLFSENPNKKWYLIGDAAASFPHRLGINYGIQSGAELAYRIMDGNHAKFMQFMEKGILETKEKAKKSSENVNTKLHYFSFLSYLPCKTFDTCFKPAEKKELISLGKAVAEKTPMLLVTADANSMEVKLEMN